MTAEKSCNENNPIRETVDSSCQGINRLFVLANERGADRVTADSHRRYFPPRVEIKNYKTEIEGRNFYEQPINNQETNDLIFAYFKKNYILIAADLNKQKAVDGDSRSIQQIVFTGKVDASAVIYYICEKSKE